MAGRIIVAALIAALMAVPAVASASGYYISQREAQADTRQAAHQEYGVNRYRTAASCRPKGVASFFPTTRLYHRWVCGWAVDYVDSFCSGAFIIAGQNPGVYGFKYEVWHGIRCYDE